MGRRLENPPLTTLLVQPSGGHATAKVAPACLMRKAICLCPSRPNVAKSNSSSRPKHSSIRVPSLRPHHGAFYFLVSYYRIAEYISAYWLDWPSFTLPNLCTEPMSVRLEAGKNGYYFDFRRAWLEFFTALWVLHSAHNNSRVYIERSIPSSCKYSMPIRTLRQR